MKLVVLVVFVLCLIIVNGMNIRITPFRIRNAIVTTVLSSALTFGTTSSTMAATGMYTGEQLSNKDSQLTDSLAAALKANSKTYSNNAKNLERMSKGDYTMGSKQTSQTDRAKKRIATAACKNGAFRSYAKVSELQCNNRVFDNDYKWVLEGLDAMEAKNNKK
jgi:hypothetical protein